MKRKAFNKLLARKRRRITKSIAKVVRKQIKKVAETKHRLDRWDVTLLSGAPRVMNLTAGIAQGDADNERIGNKINITGFSIKMILINALSSVTTTMHYAIIATGDEYAGATTSVPAGDYIKNSTADVDNWRIDPERCSVLKRGMLISRDYVGTTAEKKVFKNVFRKMNLNYTFNPASGYSKDKNYYLLYWAGSTAGGTTTIKGVFDTEVYFKDI